MNQIEHGEFVGTLLIACRCPYMETTQTVEGLAEVIALGDGTMRDVSTHIIELLTVADHSEG